MVFLCGFPDVLVIETESYLCFEEQINGLKMPYHAYLIYQESGQDAILVILVSKNRRSSEMPDIQRWKEVQLLA